MASKKSPNDGKGTKAQIDALKKAGARKPTEAITKRGQKATGLAKSKSSDRFSSTSKTKVKGATSGFAGSGTPLGASMGVNPLNKGQIAGALLAASAGGQSVAKSITTQVGKKVMKTQTKSLQRGMSKNNSKLAQTKMDPNVRQAEFEINWEKMINKQIKKKK